MASGAAQKMGSSGIVELFRALVLAEGTASHRHALPHAAARGGEAGRGLADVVHHLCALHGRHPGVIDFAAERTPHPAAADWLAAAAAGFTAERAYLTRLVVAAGPLPSTPGQAQSDATVLGQRHALEMLARSDRFGCALGAAMALVADWHAIRTVLDSAAERFGVEAAENTLPLPEDTVSVLFEVADSVPIERAVAFGAQQILVQHRGLWDLLEARAEARAAS